MHVSRPPSRSLLTPAGGGMTPVQRRPPRAPVTEGCCRRASCPCSPALSRPQVPALSRLCEDGLHGPSLSPGQPSPAVESCSHTGAGTDPPLHGWSVAQARRPRLGPPGQQTASSLVTLLLRRCVERVLSPGGWRFPGAQLVRTSVP